MKIDMKKFLLAGTAIVAVSAFPAQAKAATLTLTGNATWGTAANGMIATPTAGDTVVMATHTLTLDGSQDDINPGAITSSSTGSVLITNADDSADVSYTIGSIAITGAGNITQSLTDVTTRDIASTITGNVSTGGNLVLTNVEPDAAATNAMSIGGTLTVTGTTGITAGDAAGASTTTLDVTGNATFTGAVTVTGGDNDAAADATLTLSGATNTFTGGLALVDGAAGDAFLVLDGTVAQTVAGVISGDGDINVTNTHASGVTFTGDSTNTGTLTVNNDTNDQRVTFTGDVASAIALGDNSVADIITANFSGTTQAISGGITGGAAETVDVNFSGGSTITLSGAASSGIDTLDITGSTTVTTNQNLGAAAITVASGSTLATTANTITGAIANAGTLLFGGGSVTGAVTGAGLLDVNAAGTFTGAMTQGTADIAAFTLTQGAASGWTVGSTNFSGAGTLALLGGAQTVAGNFTNTTDGQGTITVTDVAATTAFTGNLGASTAHSLAALTIVNTGANAHVVSTTGNLFVDAITIGNTDTLSFLGTDQTVSGTIENASDTQGTISLGDGATATPTVTFNGIIGGSGNITNMTVNDNSTAIFNANATFDGALSADVGTIEVANGATFTAATQTDADVTTWNINVNKVGGGAQTNGAVVFTGDNVNLAVDTVHFQVVAGSAPLTVGASVLNNVFVGNAQNVIAGATVTDNSFLYGFALVNDTNNVDVTITQANTIDNTATTGGNANVGNVLQTDLVASTDTQINLIQGNLAAAGTAEEVNEVLESVLPSVDGAFTGSTTVMNNTVNMTGTRLAALRTGNETGMAAGNISQGVRMWAQGFGQSATQDRRDGVDGYDADTYGAAVGVDTENLSNGVVGIALSYGNTQVDSKNANRTDTDVDSYQVTVYGDYDLDQGMYVNGMVAYGHSNVDTTRHNVGGVAGLTARGDYDANQYTVRAEGGRDYAYNGMTLTPNVMGHWTHFSPDGYTETGAGGANLTVDMDSMDIAEVGVGVDASWDLKQSNGATLNPVIGVGYRYDFIGDAIEATSTLAGGGGAFASQGADPAKGTFDAGIAINYNTTDNWQFSVNYDFEYKSDYDAHNGFVRAAYKF